MVRFAAAMLIVACGMAPAPNAGAADNASERAYTLPGRGELTLAVPTAWRQEMRQPQGDLPPTIVFSPAKGLAFRVLVTPIWPAADAPAGYNSSANIRALVEDSARQVAPGAVEPTVDVGPIGGVTGYYFFATDRSLVGRTPPAGEYRHLAQGMMAVGDLLCTFTILSNDPASPVTDMALQMMRTAAHRG